MGNQTNFRRTKLLRIVLVWSFSILLALISITFYNQYREYRKAEERIAAVHNEADIARNDLDKLFLRFANLENAFRLYTVDYNTETFNRYKLALDSVKTYIDSLAVLPIQHNPLANTPDDMAYRNMLATEYTVLRQTVDQLVKHTHDSLDMITYVVPARLASSGTALPVPDMPADTEEEVFVSQDTIVRKRGSLFRRIFSARDDTIVVDVKTTRIAKIEESPGATQNAAQTTALVTTQQNGLEALRSSFARLQEKERDLINANYSLLNSVRVGIDKIRMAKIDADRITEKQDFDRFRANSNIHNKQLVFLLCMMLVMIAVLWYYIRRVTVNEIKLENERNHVEKLAEEKSAILTGISHEIRTPLSSLLGTVDLMRKNSKLYHGPDGKTYKELIDSSYHSLDAIHHTVTDILNLSRLEFEAGDVATVHFLPADTLHTVLSLQKRQAQLKGLDLRSDINIDPHLTIKSNEFRIKQITANLVGNAIKYTQQGHVLLKAAIVNAEQGGILRIEVKDTGIGISPNHIDNVFRKYYTVQSKNTAGFGLGLYITKLLTYELNGTINVTSEVGQGSTFVVETPFDDSTVEQPATNNTEPGISLSTLPDDVRYLIVDDNPINILYMKQFLANQKHIETASDPLRALELLGEQPVDVLITDINMPEMNGWELLDEIKSSGKYPNLKVLALSADTHSVEKTNAAREPDNAFDGIIPKPFTEADFASVVLKTLHVSNNMVS